MFLYSTHGTVPVDCLMQHIVEVHLTNLSFDRFESIFFVISSEYNRDRLIDKTYCPPERGPAGLEQHALTRPEAQPSRARGLGPSWGPACKGSVGQKGQRAAAEQYHYMLGSLLRTK